MRRVIPHCHYMRHNRPHHGAIGAHIYNVIVLTRSLGSRLGTRGFILSLSCISMSPKSKAKAKAKGAAKSTNEGNPHEETPKYSDAHLKSQALHYFKTVAAGQKRKATEEDVEQAKVAVQTFGKLTDCEKIDFAKKFCAGKANKDFGFVKHYSEKMTGTKDSSEVVNENYCTRTL